MAYIATEFATQLGSTRGIQTGRGITEELEKPGVVQLKDEIPAEIDPLAKEGGKVTDTVSGEEAAASTSVPPPTQSSAPDLTVDSAVQTGETNIEVNMNDGGAPEKVTAYLGGRADKPGTVIEKDGEQLVGDTN